ncbi:MAG: FxDxF family PEP-CTERM protein [Betaproteobacteria bacterium]|nr:FxDxF family PEP-CTERM protein [Betaproteobacteria bacterium]
MMQIKKTVAAIVLGLSFAGFAQAATNLGTLGFNDPLMGFSNPQGSGGNDYSFTDVYTFTVAQDLLNLGNQADTTVFSLDFGMGSGMYSLDNLTVSVFGGFNVDISTASPIFQQSVDRNAPGEMLSIYGNFPLELPEYTLVISGLTSGPSGGAPQGGLYAFTMTAAAPAVPEPAEYAMLLAGLGVVGMAARRRKMKVN